ncbi:Tas Predicted oxidoreductases (related to aryl-alcohol dehydrogenases) [Rhabdaerophilaceae bacterium]
MTSEPELEQRSLGRNALKVSALGFGAAPIGDLYAQLDDEAAIGAVVASVKAGMTLVDTAPLYGHGLAEHRVGTALRRIGRDTVTLSTKVGRWMSPARGADIRSGYFGGAPFLATIDYSYDGTLRAIEQSLLRLGTDRIEIALIHDVDRRNHGDKLESNFAEAVSGAWTALARLRDEGVIKAIGVGVNEAEICSRFAERCDLDCVLLAGRYSLLEQGALDSFLPVAMQRGIGVLLGGVFNSGILATGAVAGAKYDYADAPPAILDRVAKIEAICARFDLPLAVAALAFPRAHPAVSSIVLGAVSPGEVARNLLAWRSHVPVELWHALKREGLLHPDAPTPGQS